MDLVSTGSTLKANHLVEVEKIMDISSRLVVNQAALKLKREAVRGLIESQLPELRQRLEAAGVSVQQFDVSTDPNTGGNRNPYREAALQEFFPRAPISTGAPTVPRARIGRPDPGSLDVTV